MRRIPRIGRIVIGVAVAATTSVGLAGQTQSDARTSLTIAVDMLREQERAVRLYASQLQLQPTGPVQPGGDPFEGPVVVDAPFMGEGRTTVTQTLGDGTRIEQNATTRFYRDRAGRVRREQSIIGLGLSPGPSTPTVISIDPDPGDALAFTLDPVARTARRVPRIGAGLYMASGVVSSNTAGTPFTVGGIVQPPATAPAGRGGRGTPQPTNARTESLGTRQIEGVTATGQRTTRTIPTGQIGNDRPIEIVDERWESPELKLLIQSRFSDPRTGVVEYRLTNISRIDPAPDLFMVPTDYTVIEPPAGGRGPAPGARGAGGGARGRGQQ
jgi:hypothetical protein